MTTELSITVGPKSEQNLDFLREKIRQVFSSKNLVDFELNNIHFEKYSGVLNKNDAIAVCEKKSIDARHGNVKVLLRYKIYVGEKPNGDGETLPVWKKADGKKSVVIIGSGPAGLYAAFRLLEDGIKPIVIERGAATDARSADIERIRVEGKLDSNSNYCFGEGGAGTFSDGKLYTRSNKRGDIGKIYRIFVEFGAPEKILTDAHPHIGTDKLPSIISGMRKRIIELGGEFHFDTLCTDLIVEDGTAKGVRTRNVKTGEEGEFFGNAVILATGHSAVDIYKMIAKISPESLEAKTFAVGVRVEHPRALIDKIQFHGKEMPNAAEYRLSL